MLCDTSLIFASLTRGWVLLMLLNPKVTLQPKNLKFYKKVLDDTDPLPRVERISWK